MQKIKYISFDYSLSSPALCLSDGESFKVFVISSEKKIAEFKKDNIEVIPLVYPEWSNAQERYAKLSNLLMDHVNMWHPDRIELHSEYGLGIEDYAFAAKGRVFHIAENTQMIKRAIYVKFGKELLQIAPNVIKKVYSDKGNSNKEAMAEAFKTRNGFYLHESLGGKIDGSACDAVDSIAVNVVLQQLASGAISIDDVFKSKVKTKPNFGELKKLKPFAPPRAKESKGT